MTTLFALFVVAAALMVTVAAYGLIVTRNLMRILLSLEVMTKAVTLLIVCAGYTTGRIAVAQSYVITIIVMEVMLLVVSVGIAFGVYRQNGRLNTEDLNNLKG
ncbi:MAG: NADH-quinone oxidoreductase subunit K [Candidatus Limiplasma sp.]|nr:NADH-quinone oxidoreductase subunit K [Candidatus Limiplasma sp.]